MHILFITAVLPYPLHSGGQIRTYNLLKRLSLRHRITLVSFIRDPEELKFSGELGFCAGVHMVMRGRAWQPRYMMRALTGKYPFLMATYEHSMMRNIISDLLRHNPYDLMHIEPFYVWASLPKIDLPLVISEHNVEYRVYGGYVSQFSVPLLKPVLYWDVAKLKHWERLIWKRADALTAVSGDDAGVMEKTTNRHVSVVPNGVDTKKFFYRKKQSHQHPEFLFVGNFRWHPNREAASVLIDRIWPGLRARYPQGRLRVVGRDIPQNLSRKIRAAGAGSVSNTDDIVPVYHGADFLIAPHTISGGTKFKMLEAMASGVSVITTREGMQGLQAKKNVHYLEADEPDSYVEAVSRLWADADAYTRIVRNARRFVESHYAWDHIADKLEAVWEQAYEDKHTR